MWIRIEALLCCILASALAANEPRSKKKDDPRGKRTLEYSISHNHNPGINFRSERRIATGFPISQAPQYPLFYPVQKPFTVFRKGRPNVSAPPYAVQMEPLVHYSQRDPLYDANSLSAVAKGTNELKHKEDLIREHSHNSRVHYAYPPAKHVVERPVYIKEPEPIIEIIIKESNITLPPLPTPPVTVAPRKKEHVQVFYVKYKKNPNGYGKDSIIYDKPVPALTPHVPEDPEPVEHPLLKYEALHTATLPPPPSTTLRAIVKPDSESYHADKGIHITFGKTVNDQHKRSSFDDAKEESAPEPSVAHTINQPQLSPQPQARQYNPFPSQPLFPTRPPTNVNFENSHPIHFKPENQRFHNEFRHAPPPVSFKQTQFNRELPHGHSLPHNQQLPSTRSPPNFSNQPFPPRTAPQLNNQHIPPRQPVPYQPFEQIRPQQPQVQFPRTHTHFPVTQQNQHQPFNPQFNNGIQNTQSNNQQFQNPPRNSQYHQLQPTFQPSQPPFSQQPISQHDNVFQQQAHFSHQQQHIPQQQHGHQIQIAQEHNIPQQHHSQSQHIQQQRNPVQQHIPQQQQNAGQHYQQQLLSVQQRHIPQQQIQYNQQQLLNNAPQPERSSELIQSVPKYEQHISVPVGPQLQNPSLLQQQHQQSQPQIQISQQSPNYQTNFNRNQQEYNYLLQQQFKQSVTNQPPQLQNSAFFQPTPKPTTTTTTTTTTTSAPTTEGRLTESDLKALNIQLPDEVPDDLREQLLSSGILKNAQISILDYDKIGDTSLSDLPPDQLANFFGAGGGQQISAASEIKPVVVSKDGELIKDASAIVDTDMEESESAPSEVKVPAPVEMKVVHYDPQSTEGQKVQDSYIEEGATQVDPVSLDDQQYTRYLPVKVNGAAFPIPDVPELKGRSITSVVVLAPVDLNVQENQRKVREVSNNHSKGARDIAAEALKTLISNPTTQNFKDWLDKENKTIPDKQAVVLLVTGDSQPASKEKEIFMYDLATQTVSKLSGELSSAFVEAAETNAKQNLASLQTASSNIIETRIPYPQESDTDIDEAASEYVETKLPIDHVETDSLSEASEQLESFVDISGMPVQEDLVAAASNTNGVSISSGYSKTGSSK